MFKKVFIILFSIILLFSLTACNNNSKETTVGTTTQTQENNVTEQKDTFAENIIPNPQGVSKYEKDNLIAIKYLVLKEQIAENLDTDFVYKVDNQVKYTLENVFDNFKNGIKKITHTYTKTIVKNDKTYILDEGVIDNLNYKTIYTLSASDNRYVIINCYISLNGDITEIDKILSQSFSKEELKQY